MPNSKVSRCLKVAEVAEVQHLQASEDTLLRPPSLATCISSRSHRPALHPSQHRFSPDRHRPAARLDGEPSVTQPSPSPGRSSIAHHQQRFAMSSRIPDETLSKVLEKIQLQVYQTNQQLSALRAQIAAREREAKLNTLTLTELQAIQDPNAPFYRSVGKMFLQESQPVVLSELEQKQTAITSDLEALQKKQKREDAQAHLKDIFSSVNRQQQQEA
ncbi:60s acidic ribosomal protein P1 [Moesziomyces antarcticus T-34]|uniref:60s acidic ribosomal protein P1 n=1 Tax=Pseudozyma antarctica (strain T-34) TaxID=1151754 RepID=M9LZ17_PSEA3|nr:60s acidic ribosomal protein P1 [Moesziomyces antarcticus T-34]